jgi:hypothetical protein
MNKKNGGLVWKLHFKNADVLQSYSVFKNPLDANPPTKKKQMVGWS